MINFDGITSNEIGAHNIANILCKKYVKEMGCSLKGPDSNEDIAIISDVINFYDIAYNEALVRLTKYSTIKD